MKISNILLLVLSLHAPLLANPPWRDVFTFSELKSVSLEKLEKGEVIGVRIELDGSELSLGVESFYAVEIPPAEVLKKINTFSLTDSEANQSLDVKLHVTHGSPAHSNHFSQFNLDPSAQGYTWFLEESAKSINGFTCFNLSKNETRELSKTYKTNKLFPDSPFTKDQSEKIAQTWRDLLQQRALNFQKGGLMGSAPYEGSDGTFELGKEFVRALKSRPKLLQNFSAVLDPVMAGRPVPNALAPTYYWEKSIIQGAPTISLSAIFSQPTQQGYRVAEITYYVTGNYYGGLILYELYPTKINGKNGTLIYRSDVVLSPSMTYIKGIERMAAGNILLLEIKNSALSFIQASHSKN